jgi:hypothetical protein
VERKHDKNFKLLKRKYQVFAFVPTLGAILAITPIKSISIWLTRVFGIDAYEPVLDQQGGLAFFLTIMIVFLLVLLIGAAVGFFIVATYLKQNEGLTVMQSLRAFANGKYPAHWLKNGHH